MGSLFLIRQTMNQPQEWALAHAAGEQPRNQKSVERKMLKALSLKLTIRLKMAPHYTLLLRLQFDFFPSQPVTGEEFTLSRSLSTPSWIMVIDLSLHAMRSAQLAPWLNTAAHLCLVVHRSYGLPKMT